MQRLIRAYFAALDPRLWLPMARAIRVSEGWCPPMMLVAVIGVVGFGGGFIRGSIVAATCLYAWASCWAVVFSIAASLAFYDSLRNLVRLGVRGYTRSRFWFELARSCCIVAVFAAVLTLSFGYAGPPIASFVGDILLLAVISCFAVFCIASTIGYLAMLATRQRPAGRAKQCVNFFYPQCLGALVMAGFLFWFRRHLDDPWTYVPAIAILVAICLLGALALTLIDRWKHHPPPNTVDAR